MEIVEIVLTSVISSIVASSIFLLILRKLRPRIVISPEIAFSEEGGIKRYHIKILNKGMRNIVDIRAELSLVKMVNVPNGFVLKNSDISLNKDSAFILSSFNKKDTNAKYARRFHTLANIDELWSSDDSQFLIFRLYCHDEVSGFGKVFTKEYRTKRNSIKSGQFHFGNDLSIS